MSGRAGPRIWTTWRKLAGNIIPGILGGVPATIGGVQMARSLDLTGPGLRWLGAGVVVAWISVNLFGLYANRRMRKELAARLDSEKPGATTAGIFVGVTTPQHRGWLDAHEDVAFLFLDGDRLKVVGDRLQVVLKRDEVKRIRYRANIHTWVGLGRWVSLRGSSQGTDIRLDLEPRERSTLLGNLRYSRELRKRIDAWWKQKTAQT